jgi:hypothetical protein
VADPVYLAVPAGYKRSKNPSGRPDLNRGALTRQECVHQVVACVNVRLCRSGGPQANAPKQIRALVSSPGTIGDMARAALVLVRFGHEMIN